MTDSIVFSSKQNSWILVKVPAELCVEGYEEMYATLFTHLVDKGVSEQRASQIAEAAVLKRQYPGLQYDSKLENDLLQMN